MNDLGLDLPRQLRVENLVHVLAQRGPPRKPTHEVRSPLPSAVEEAAPDRSAGCLHASPRPRRRLLCSDPHMTVARPRSRDRRGRRIRRSVSRAARARACPPALESAPRADRASASACHAPCARRRAAAVLGAYTRRDSSDPSPRGQAPRQRAETQAKTAPANRGRGTSSVHLP